METLFSIPFLVSRCDLFRVPANPSSTDSASSWLTKVAVESAPRRAQMDGCTPLDEDPSVPIEEEEGNDGNTENTRGNTLLSSPNPGDCFVGSCYLKVGFLGEA